MVSAMPAPWTWGAALLHIMVLVTAAAPKSTTGGSKVCSHTGFFSKKVVPMCEKHFPEEASKNAWVVQFYHPQVQGVHDAQAGYEALAASDKLGGSKVGAVDCKENQEFCQTQGIRGVPLTRILSSGRSRDYEGEHSAEKLVSWVLESVQKFKEMDDLLKCEIKGLFSDSMKDSTIPLCTSSFPPNVEQMPWITSFYERGDQNKDKTMRKTMNKMAEKFGNTPPKKVDAKNKKPRKLRVGAIDCSHKDNDCEKLGITKLPTVRFYSSWATEPKVYDSFIDFDELKEFADAGLKEQPKQETVTPLKADMDERDDPADAAADPSSEL